MAVRSLVRMFGLTLASAAFLGLVGCSELTGDSDHSSSSDRTSSRTADHYDISGIPRSAEMLDSGNGEVSVKAPERGTVYLVDLDSSRTVWSGRIDRGERFTVDPENDRAAINGRVVYERNLERKHRHAVYFDPSDYSRDSRDSRYSHDRDPVTY